MEDNKDNTELNKNESNDINVTDPAVVAPEAATSPSLTTNNKAATAPSVESDVVTNAAEEPAVAPAETPAITPSGTESQQPIVSSTESTTESVTSDTPAPTVINPLPTDASDQPANPSVLAISNDAPQAPGAKKGLPAIVISVVLLILGLGVGFAAAGFTGFSMGSTGDNKSSEIKAPVVVEKELTVPKDATVIAECAKGRGKQYVLPKDIPQGPVYNVWNGKVIGIEYMLGQKEVAANKDFLDLPLENVKYDHINIGLLSKGHSGFPEPHYHVDVFTVSHEEAVKITCQ